MADHVPLINQCAILSYVTPFPLLKKQFKIKFLIRDAPLGVTLEYEKFDFELFLERSERNNSKSNYD